MSALDGVAGCHLFSPVVHADGRGSNHEWFRAEPFTTVSGHLLPVAQANCVVSRRGVIRGIHFAAGQAKYVTCVRGAIIDVAVDVRTGSPGFGHWEAARLDDQNHDAMYLAAGLGHAFLTRSEESVVVYLCSAPYDPARDRSVHPLDPALGIGWPIDKPVLSDRDAAAPTLEEARRAGILPEI